MQGAFVVQLGAQSEDEIVGRVEEVDTGRSLRFRSGKELLDFLKREDTRRNDLRGRVPAWLEEEQNRK